ncbi:MAG: peptide ABC transporter substrate-binding protein [Planctomycetota bacterium]|nr:peptide ABC transporter substrate-binding protein [Planctomycetota bacterium]
MKLLAMFGLMLAVLAAVAYLDDPPTRAELVFVNRSEVFTLDPQRMSWLQDFRIAYALYEGLVRWDNKDFSIEPAAAEWTLSEDRLSYTFAIRPDARWSNGDPLTAHDFIYSWRRAILPDTAADYSNIFFVIRGAEEFFRWRADALDKFVAANAQLDPDTRAANALDLWEETIARFEETFALKALDDRTLRVTLVHPTTYFLDLVAFGVFHPVHRPTVEGWQVDEATAAKLRQFGWSHLSPPSFANRRFVKINSATGRLEQKHGWTKPKHLVCNGPYVLTQWRYKRGLRMERNASYHSSQRVHSASIECVSIEDTNTAILAFESGQIDWLSDVSAEYQADMLAQRQAYEQRYAHRIQAMLAEGRSLDDALAALPKPQAGERRNIHVFPTFGTDFYSFNCRPILAGGRVNPFADPAVRRAFVMSVDRDAIVQQVTRLNEPVATTLIPPGSIPGYQSPAGLKYAPSDARAELKAAGWEDRTGDGLIEDDQGRPFPVVDLLYSTNTPRYKNISIVLKDMWQRELGVRVELRGKESKFFKEDLITGNFMIGRGRWYGDYGDPTTFLDLFKTGDGNNDRGYSNAYVDELLQRAARETDPQRRMRILEECERFLFAEEVPMLVLCQLVQLYMYEPAKVTGLSRHPRLTQYLWQMKVRDP